LKLWWLGVVTEDDSNHEGFWKWFVEKEIHYYKRYINIDKVERFNSKFAEIGVTKIPLSEKKEDLVKALLCVTKYLIKIDIYTNSNRSYWATESKLFNIFESIFSTYYWSVYWYFDYYCSDVFVPNLFIAGSSGPWYI
jgi:hypothetical protein